MKWETERKSLFLGAENNKEGKTLGAMDGPVFCRIL